MTEIPNGLPTLAGGKHRPDEGEACVMEYCSVITGDQWTDLPACTNRIIAKAAQSVNDNLGDADRHLLVPFIGRLMEAGQFSMEIDTALLGRLGLTNFGSDPCNWITHRMSATIHNWTGDDVWRQEYSYNPQAGLDLLDALLTIHEKMTGRTPKQVDPEALSRARTLIETGAGLV